MKVIPSISAIIEPLKIKEVIDAVRDAQDIIITTTYLLMAMRLEHRWHFSFPEKAREKPASDGSQFISLFSKMDGRRQRD